MRSPTDTFIAKSRAIWKDEPRQRGKKLHKGRLAALLFAAITLIVLALVS